MTEIIGRATIHNMDNMEFMKGCKNNQFDLAIVDPPYGIGESGGSNNSRGSISSKKRISVKNKTGAGVASTQFIDKEWDNVPAPKEYFIELQRISTNQIIWGANHFIRNIPNLNSSCWIVWDKDNGLTDFADCELALSSFNTAVRKFKFKWNGMLQEDMKKKQKRIHPTQKPIQLYEWLLTNYAKQGDTILDTHMGSGSIAIATNKLGFDLTAMELDKDYYKAACKRIRESNNQVDMFTPVEPVAEPQEDLF